jgi:hypothetical protein
MTLPIIWEGEIIEIRTSAGLETCAGTFSSMDRFAVELHATAGFARDWGPVDVRWLDEEDYASAVCAVGSGCTHDQDVYVAEVPLDHELVHAAYQNEYGYGVYPLVLGEGVAEYFGDDVSRQGDVPSIQEVVDTRDDYLTGGGYVRAGHFVSYLIETRGLEQFNSVMSRSRGDDAPPQLGPIFSEVYGETLDDLLMEYSSYSECSRRSWRRPVLECEGEALPWDRSGTIPAISFADDLECDDPATIGPRNGRVWTTRVFEIEEPGEYRFTMNTDGGDTSLRTAKFVACDADCAAPFDVVIENDPFGAAKYEVAAPGRYYMQLERSSDLDAFVSVEVSGPRP